MNAEPASPGISFYALGPEFEWLASAWDGFARELAEISGMLRHVAEAAASDPHLAAESSGLAALESATDRLVRELVDDAVRIRRTQATYEQADAAVHAAVPAVPSNTVITGHVAGQGAGSWAGSGVGYWGGGEAADGVGAEAAPTFGGGGTMDAGAHESRGSAPAPAAEAFPGTLQGAPPDESGLWHPAEPRDLSETALGTLSRFRRQILARAEHWVSQHVPYNQGLWHEGYRTDCSGYVSMCWGLRDSMVTSTMPQIAHRIAKEDLRAGDVLLNTDVATGHVILFDRWADYAHNSYVGFELCPQGTLHHVIPYPYYGGFGVYEPYRYNNVGD
ncbi:hypothetical protein [Catenulispora subtropica]|uniref:NlpC/P60 domain-containing protein n=1 Tax=Catenulispora subtropica TaxID=450798 RepID=A0ABN2QF49_9ACTN